uniref:Sushi domain-containing protein n=1 Tax=Angiostrongylus cantonensis TaxID=6313 RepID=A0A0K0D986_ANGCA
MGRAELNLILYVLGIVTIPSSVFGGACPEIQAPSGAAISFTGQISEGTTITAICTNGGIMNGPSMLTCIGGQWRPSAFGTCSTTVGTSGTYGGTTGSLGAQCLPMLLPPGATLTYGNGSMSSGLAGLQNHGTTVTMKCNDNTPVTGVSGILPSTNMLTPFASGEMMCHFGLIAPLNGDIEYSSGLPASAGATATLTCRTGYTVRGNSVSTCQNGIFGMLGTCEKAK